MLHAFYERRTLNVYVNGTRRLGLRNDIANHSNEFQIAYHGSGPAQLALSIACDHFGDEIGKRIYQELKSDIIATLKAETDFIITSKQLNEWFAGRSTEKAS